MSCYTAIVSRSKLSPTLLSIQLLLGLLYRKVMLNRYTRNITYLKHFFEEQPGPMRRSNSGTFVPDGEVRGSL